MTRLKREAWIQGLAARAESVGSQPRALEFGGGRVDYAELAISARATRVSLLRLGVEPGDLVGVLAPPSIAGVVLIHAMLDLGVVFLPLNARLTEGEQRDALASADARFLLVEDGTTDTERLVRNLGTGLLTFSQREGKLCDGLELSIRVRASEGLERRATGRRGGQLATGAALVLQTSGTSGRPKCAVLTFDNLMASADASAELLESGANDRWLLCMPLFHIGGLSILIRCALVGATVLLQPRFDPDSVATALEEGGITHVSFVAAMLERVLNIRAGQFSPESLSLVLLGGGPATQTLLARAESLGYPVAPTYGLTEASSQVATRPPDVAQLETPDRAGGLIPLPGIEVRVVDEEGCPVRGRSGEGIEGEIEVRGPVVMAGYLDDRAATEGVMRGGWLATGDQGLIDERGRLRVLDRRSDLILSGGENVYPAEIESMLVEFEGVREAGVFGVPDENYGARPVAFIALEEGREIDPAALSEFCRGRMAGFKRPVDFVEIGALPRTATGKLRRRELRSMYAQRR
jgi:O-succinylbenzoic acid--CoA ligase